ncbi:hypothetical protein B0J12DRAFT_664030 [Macrophomina phaseolina]|uniref:Uncharacterized protein n=1 Tax=Macrophomina phaseolina TaxID=35725 RepID=A0ABQ8G973_9PEZI|nr:hypothetical protein B0J12DRAFT_664030 [Macrophomina phaseolina]
MAIRKTWHLGFRRAKSQLCQEISLHNSGKGPSGDFTAAERSSSLGHEETQPEFDNFLGDFEDIHPGKIIPNPETRPYERWAVKISGQPDEWKRWNLVSHTNLVFDKLLFELGLPTRELIRKVLDSDASLCNLDDKDKVPTAVGRRIVYDGLVHWLNLKADAEKALSEHLRVHGPEDFAALPEGRLQKHERNEFWGSCSDSSKEVLRWTWSRLPNGEFQNHGWRGVLSCVATLDAKDLDLGKADDIRLT